MVTQRLALRRALAQVRGCRIAHDLGRTYYLMMTTQGGLLRYRIGDRIRFTETRPPLFVVLGKPEDQIDLSAEKTGVQQASEVLSETAATMGGRISDFLVCPVAGTLENVQLAHEWILESERNRMQSSSRRNLSAG